tara:strand:+ start:429 stop:614 length:186 start_codon:yes stop_codon:yes gene_type:complete
MKLNRSNINNLMLHLENETTISSSILFDDIDFNIELKNLIDNQSPYDQAEKLLVEWCNNNY